MRIKEIQAREFAKEEYNGFHHTTIDGDNLLIFGGNRTGKTLTFNALLYNLLGPRNTIDLSTGRRNHVKLSFDNGIEFHRGQPEAVLNSEEGEFTGSDAQEELATSLSEDLSNEIKAEQVIKTHFLHSHIGRLPLSRLSKENRLALIRGVVDRDVQQEIEEIDIQTEELENQQSEKESQLRRLKEDQTELQNENRSARNQLEKYQRLNSLIESGQLEGIADELQKDTEIQEQLSSLYKEKENLRQTRRSQKKLRDKWQRYHESERRAIIAEAVNDFVCPACGDRVDSDLAETRLSQSRCPFCAVDERGDDLKTDIEDKIDRSEEQIESLNEEIEEIDVRVEEIEDEISNLKDNLPEIEDVDSFTERKLREHNYETSSIVGEVESELEKYHEKVEETEDALEDRESQISQLEEEIEQHKSQIEGLYERKAEIKQESLEAEIEEFTKRWVDIFQSLAGEIGLDIHVTDEGDVEIPGNEGLRQYDRSGDLSDAEMIFLNISFIVTFNRFARESEITKWQTIIIDEPFSNLDTEGQEELLDFIKSAEEQFICTSSNELLLEEFAKTGELERQTIQASLGRFLQ